MAAPREVSSSLRERWTRRPITSAMSWTQYGDALIAPPLATISWVGEACGERRRATIATRQATASSQACRTWTALVAGWMPAGVQPPSVGPAGAALLPQQRKRGQ